MSEGGFSVTRNGCKPPARRPGEPGSDLMRTPSDTAEAPPSNPAGFGHGGSGGRSVADTIRFEDAACELCGEPPTEHLLKTPDLVWHKPGEFNLVRCTRCNLIITTPRPVPESMPIYYEDWYNYRPLEEVKRERTGSALNRFLMWMRLKILEKTGRLEAGSKVLDVGAGFGAQLQYYMHQRDIQATAIDFDPIVTQNSLISDQADVRSGDLLDAGFEANSFDVVTLYQSLEHVYHPLATVREAYRILKPGGRLVVEVPDIDAPWRKLFKQNWSAILAPTHLYHFSRDSLQRVVTTAGFEPMRHVGVYFPFESSISLAIGYVARRKIAMYEAIMPSRVFKAPFRHVPFFVFLVIWTFGFDLPLQFWLWLFGRTGAQALISRKPT